MPDISKIIATPISLISKLGPVQKSAMTGIFRSQYTIPSSTKVVTYEDNRLKVDGSTSTFNAEESTQLIFNLSDSSLSGHPFTLATANDESTNYANVTSSGTPGQAGATLTTTLPAYSSNQTLWWYCSNHSSEGASFAITEASYNLVTTDLILRLETFNTDSYPGSGTTWTDIASEKSFSSTGTQTPKETVDGVVSFGFNGSGHWIGSGTSGTNIDMAGPVTLIMWVFAENSLERDGIFEKAGNSYNSYEQEIAVTWEILDHWSFYSSYNTYDHMQTTRLHNGSWNMVAIKMTTGKTTDARDGKMSLNGAAWSGTYTSRSNTAIVPAGEIYIGKNYTGEMHYGNVAAVLVYDREITDAELLENYNYYKEDFGHSRAIDTLGLIAWYDVGNTDSYSGSGTTWNDLSGVGSSRFNSPLTLSGAALTSTHMYFDEGDFARPTGNSYQFYNSYGNTADEVDPGVITLEAWIKPLTATDDRAPIMFVGTVYFQVYQDNKLATYWYGMEGGAGQGYHYSTANSITMGNWHHVAVTWGPTGGIKFYINGSLDTTISSSGSGNGWSQNTHYLGYESGTRRYKGDIDIARIYEKELSLTQIQQNYNAEKSRFGL